MHSSWCTGPRFEPLPRAKPKDALAYLNRMRSRYPPMFLDREILRRIELPFRLSTVRLGPREDGFATSTFRVDRRSPSFQKHARFANSIASLGPSLQPGSSMTSTTITTALIAALAILPATAAQTDFSGTWVLDASRSEGLPEGMGQSTITVKQSGDRIEVEIHTMTPAGERRTQDVYVLNGQETDFKPILNVEASATGKRTARWSDGGNGFEATETATVQGPQGEITITSVRKWTLAPGGDGLTIEMTSSGPQGEMKTTRVFTRREPPAE
jgi:hypothetical protein